MEEKKRTGFSNVFSLLEKIIEFLLHFFRLTLNISGLSSLCAKTNNEGNKIKDIRSMLSSKHEESFKFIIEIKT
jgi:hypothetical protein